MVNETIKIVAVTKDQQICNAITKLSKMFTDVGEDINCIFISSLSEMKEYLKVNKDVALIFIETNLDIEFSVWDAVNYIRKTLSLEALRIFLCAEEMPVDKEAVLAYNISDIKTVDELFEDRMFVAISATIWSYTRIKEIDESGKRLEKLQHEIEAIASLKQNERQFQGILDSLLIPIFITRISDNNILFINKNAKDKFGISTERGIEILKADLYVDPEDYKQAMAQVLRYGSLEDFETEMKTASGTRFHALRSSKIIEYHGEDCELASFKDITSRKMLEEELRWLATKDSLTNLNNRRNFFKLGTMEIRRAKRFDRKLSVMMLDIDYFKKVNDTYGHKAGDKVLVTFAKEVVNLLREIDIFGRIGGEEFAIILPETGLPHTTNIADRLRKDIERIAVEVEEDLEIKFTVSIGVTELHPKDINMDELLGRADTALYMAKEAGRNRVEAIA